MALLDSIIGEEPIKTEVQVDLPMKEIALTIVFISIAVIVVKIFSR